MNVMHLLYEDPLLPWSATMLALAVPVRLYGGRAAVWLLPRLGVYEWTLHARADRALRTMGRRGWQGRHGLSGRLVADIAAGRVTVAELEARVPRPAVEDVDMSQAAAAAITDDEQRFLDEMHATAEVFSEIAADDQSWLLGEPTDAERDATIAAIQEKTTEVMVIDADVRARWETRAEFAEGDAMYAAADLAFATNLGVFLGDNDHLLALLAVARSCRPAGGPTTGEYPVLAGAVAA